MISKISTGVWRPWTPSDSEPWNVLRVVHFHKRVGFAANWETIQRDLREGPAAAIDRILNPVVDHKFEQTSSVIGEAAKGSESPSRLKAWWIYRMLFSSDPLSERLALMWHNHFATSNLKVASLELMLRQNKLFRDYGLGPFAELLRHVAKDPAMLIWLDADANRKEHPNENLASEIMELFTLGVGNYTETDVRQAARALTGWSVRDGRFRDDRQKHDEGEKCILGKIGNWDGDDLVNLLVEHPATANRLSLRLCEQFLGEEVATSVVVDELAAQLRANQLNIRQAVETIVRSSLFFSDQNLGNRVPGPVEFLVNLVRSLELLSPSPSTLLLAEWSGNLGQDLFYPPNVFGWPGGRSWLTTRSIIGRSNFVSALLCGTNYSPHHPFDAQSLAMRHGFRPAELPEFLGRLISGRDLSSTVFKRHDKAPTESMSIEQVVLSILTSPAGLLG